MSVVPGEPEPVGGQVEVFDLLRQNGGVSLLPTRDGNVVTRLMFR